jgi:hypothetical protein
MLEQLWTTARAEIVIVHQRYQITTRSLTLSAMISLDRTTTATMRGQDIRRSGWNILLVTLLKEHASGLK